MRAPLSLLLIIACGAQVVPETACMASPALPFPAASQLASDGDPSFVRRHRRPLIWGTALTAAAAGTMAIITRQQANERFAEYERAADPERISTLFDETTRLDNRAAVFFIVAEVAFVSAVVIAVFVAEPALGTRASASSSAVRASSGEPAWRFGARPGASWALSRAWSW